MRKTGISQQRETSYFLLSCQLASVVDMGVHCYYHSIENVQCKQKESQVLESRSGFLAFEYLQLKNYSTIYSIWY